MPSVSYWMSVGLPEFPPLQEDLSVDVAVVGGGMTGISTAYLLKSAGARVALLERDRCAQQDTGSTTAHLTFVTDRRLTQLVKQLGRDHAAAVWDAGAAAIQQIEAIVRREQIDCDFAWAPGFLHAALKEPRDEHEELEREAGLAKELGFDAAYVTSTPLIGRPGIRFPNQAVFHPRKYLAELMKRIPGGGSRLFELSEVTEFEEHKSADGDKRIRMRANGRTVECDYVVIATDVPLAGVQGLFAATLLQTKIAPYTSYAIGGRLPRGLAPQACFWDTSDPYYFLRVTAEGPHDYAIFGGLDHKTGQVEDTERRFDQLEQTLRELTAQFVVDRRWSGQVIESHDGLPLVGFTSERQFVATGFSGNGLTFGMLAAMMACDAIRGGKNPWAELFDPQRTTLVGGAWNYVRENADYPYYMMKDWLSRADAESLDTLRPGEGAIRKVDGRRVAAYRDPAGRLVTLSPVCTHLGCVVHWNESESTWDCPCHGSRFRATGEVLAGPAETPLKPIDSDADESKRS